MKILLGVDDSSFSRAAAEGVAQRLWRPGTHVRIISVVESSLDFSPAESGRENQFKIARASVDHAVAALRKSESRLEITGDIIEGSPKQVLLDEAESWGADLIVVGSHGRRGLDRFLLGSVSQAIALHAPCSVEIVRAPGKDKKA
jgi:nucleotide-binding universal stress UspA family protein